jgi:hypothetical protein
MEMGAGGVERWQPTGMVYLPLKAKPAKIEATEEILFRAEGWEEKRLSSQGTLNK